jgi:hypothetical protein
MIRTVEAVIDQQGHVRLLEPVKVEAATRALVTILEDDPPHLTALLSEPALAEDWNRPEEDQAWSHLQDPLAGLEVSTGIRDLAEKFDKFPL